MRKSASRDIEIEVRNLLYDERVRASDGKPPSLLPVPVLGPFYTYQVIAPETVHSTSKQLLLDLGFSARMEMEIFLPKKFPAGTIVTSAKAVKGLYSLKTAGPQNKTQPSVLKAQDSLLYTYKAYVERVVDGDTLHVEFRLGFGQLREETIRLRGIDCPELDTPEGQAAKRFVERELGACEFITVKSTQTRKEKWGRYLGDVFYTDKTGKQVYLNNLLLEKGYAVRVRE
jgi:endonuclease YncB( thermonuclease family)